MQLLKLDMIISNDAVESSVVFFPGGPGLSWHCFADLPASLAQMGSVYGLSYNQPAREDTYFNDLMEELIILLEKLSNPVLITHSFSSMLVLSNAYIPPLKGLILISPASSNDYAADLPQRLKMFSNFDGSAAAAEFWFKPSNEAYATYFKKLAPFYFKEACISTGIPMLEKINFTYKPYVLFVSHFLPHYTTAFAPNVPTLALFGETDPICPSNLFNPSLTLEKDNITVATILQAGHFPWIEEPLKTIDAIKHWHDRTFSIPTTTS